MLMVGGAGDPCVTARAFSLGPRLLHLHSPDMPALRLLGGQRGDDITAGGRIG